MISSAAVVGVHLGFGREIYLAAILRSLSKMMSDGFSCAVGWFGRVAAYGLLLFLGASSRDFGVAYMVDSGRG